MTPKERAEKAAAIMWENDPASPWIGLRLDTIDEGRSKMSLVVQDHHVNGHDICHGGIIFTLADSAFAFACNSRNQMTVAAGARIDFIKSAKEGDVLTASARVVHQGKRTGVYDAQVVNQAQEVIAEFRGNSTTIGGQLVDESAS